MTSIFTQEKYNRLKELLQAAKKVVVVSHVNPDGDAIGSSLAFAGVLKKTVQQVNVIMPNRYPEYLKWMSGTNDILTYQDKKDTVEQLISEADLIFCLDFNTLKRIESLGKHIDESKATKILIDHHPDPSEEFDLLFSYIPASSTSELVYRIVVAVGLEKYIDKDISECIYCGIMTDTGSFSHSSSNPELFRIVACLLEHGIDKAKISSYVYDNFSEYRIRLMGYSISSKMVVLDAYKAAFITLSKEELDKYKFQPGDTEGFVNIPLSIKGILLSVFLVEAFDKSHIKVSIRTRGSLSANEIARSHFNGGGHKNAAGGKLFCTLDEAVLLLKSILPQYE